MNLEQIAADLLTLPVSDRANLAKTLADSVDDFTDGRIEREWAEVVDVRLKEADSGKAGFGDSEQVHRIARVSIADARQAVISSK